MINKFFGVEFLKFLFVGVINTVLSAMVMFMLYNLEGMGYWGASIVSYVLGAILSFFLNKNYTFNNKDSIMKTAFKFSINVAICYVIAYSIAKPTMTLLLSGTGLSVRAIEQIAMVFGMVLYTLINYFGQRFFAFKDKDVPKDASL